MKKANVRTSYEIAKQKDGTHRLFLHPYVSNNKVANNLAEAGELMKQAVSYSKQKKTTKQFSCRCLWASTVLFICGIK